MPADPVRETTLAATGAGRSTGIFIGAVLALLLIVGFVGWAAPALN